MTKREEKAEAQRKVEEKEQRKIKFEKKMKDLDESEEKLRNEIHCIEYNNNIFERSDRDIRSRSPD